MGFLTKTIVERKAAKTGAKVGRVAVDMGFTRASKNGAVRELYTISKLKFTEMGLDGNSISFTDSPLTMVVVKENSPLALTMYAKGEKSKEKARTFGLPELTKILEKANLIPTDRQDGFKAVFKLVTPDHDSSIFNNVLSQAGEHSGDVSFVYAIELVEITSFTPTTRTKKEVVSQVEMFPVVDQTVLNDQPVVEEVEEYTGEEDDDIEID